MNRLYENPHKLEDMIKQVEAQLDSCDPDADEERYIDLHEELAELKDRLNFAWQDDEASCEGWDY